jgi:trehalose utilization protein
MITVKATCTSHNAKKIERTHGDPSTVRWIGASKFEKEQLFIVDGHSEILLELAANREIENFEIIEEYENDYVPEA